MSHSVLIIEDEEVLGRDLCQYLDRFGWQAHLATSTMQGLAMLEEIRPDAVVLDFNLPDIDGLQALMRAQELGTGARVVVVCGHGSIDMAVEAMKAGACDFVAKPVAPSALRVRLEKAVGQARREGGEPRRERDPADARPREAELPAPGSLRCLIGESEPMRELKRTLQQLLDAEAQMQGADPPAVLVLGETGAGKEVVARALHDNGPRRDRPFVEMNCAALPAQLLESELFGHERGAFTDARDRKLGLVETAEGGTLFLDEVGDMDLGLQAKLLKLLEEKTMRRLGSVREQRVSVRIIAATHQPLEALVREGRFRADLFYRLCVVQLRLPALRERGHDIMVLAEHFVAQLAARYGKPAPRMAEATRAVLQRHPWAGNVRELRNALEQAVLLYNEPTLQPWHLSLVQVEAAAVPADAPAEASAASADPAMGAGARPIVVRSVVPAAAAEPPSEPLHTLRDIERHTLLTALLRHGWNVSRAARALGISRDTMRYRIEKHGLQSETTAAFADSARLPL